MILYCSVLAFRFLLLDAKSKSDIFHALFFQSRSDSLSKAFFHRLGIKLVLTIQLQNSIHSEGMNGFDP